MTDSHAPPDPEPKPRYWFPAKTYGWGWGSPATWEGWVVFVGYLVLLHAGGCFFILFDALGVIPFLANAAFWTVILNTILKRKGEPPRWRWGDKEWGRF